VSVNVTSTPLIYWHLLRTATAGILFFMGRTHGLLVECCQVWTMAALEGVSFCCWASTHQPQPIANASEMLEIMCYDAPWYRVPGILITYNQGCARGLFSRDWDLEAWDQGVDSSTVQAEARPRPRPSDLAFHLISLKISLLSWLKKQKIIAVLFLTFL